MPNQELIDYTKSQVKKGVALKKIKEKLAEAGWSASDIEKAISSALTKSEKVPKPRYREVIPILSSIKKGFQIILLDKNSMQEIAESDTTLNAIIILLISGLLLAMTIPENQLPEFLQSSRIALILILLPLIIVASFVSYGIMHILAKLFGGKAKFIEFYRAIAHTNVVYWPVSLIQPIPYLGRIISVLTGLWLIVVNVFIFKVVHKLNTVRAVIVALIPYFAFVLFFILLIFSLFLFVPVYMRMIPLPHLMSQPSERYCDLSKNIQCKDFQMTPDTIKLTIENNAEKDVVIASINYHSDEISHCWWFGNQTIEKGNSAVISTLPNCSITELEELIKINIVLRYHWKDEAPLPYKTVIGVLVDQAE